MNDTENNAVMHHSPGPTNGLSFELQATDGLARRGRMTLNHGVVERWSVSAGAVLLCGRYEGIDQRFIDQHVNVQLSLGDFVLSGGEIPAMMLQFAQPDDIAKQITPSGKKTIAEYAESEEIITLLRALGVDYAQGYGVAMPERLTTTGEGWASHLG